MRPLKWTCWANCMYSILKRYVCLCSMKIIIFITLHNVWQHCCSHYKRSTKYWIICDDKLFQIDLVQRFLPSFDSNLMLNSVLFVACMNASSNEMRLYAFLRYSWHCYWCLWNDRCRAVGDTTWEAICWRWAVIHDGRTVEPSGHWERQLAAWRRWLCDKLTLKERAAGLWVCELDRAFTRVSVTLHVWMCW